MWRNAVDLTDSWDRVYKVIRIYGDNSGNFLEAAGPGHWNDADEVCLRLYHRSYTGIIVVSFGFSESSDGLFNQSLVDMKFSLSILMKNMFCLHNDRSSVIGSI